MIWAFIGLLAFLVIYMLCVKNEAGFAIAGNFVILAAFIVIAGGILASAGLTILFGALMVWIPFLILWLRKKI